MRLLAILGPLLGFGCLATLLPVLPTKAYTLGTNNLSVDARYFCVFNNFSDVSANNNLVQDSNFPGHQGAVMAIWKASVEWGSTLHGNGAGYSSQPNDLGSGGANFDLSFQGLAQSPDALGGNVHSEISGSAGGTYAFAEIGPNGGWRIRYFSVWTWDDGPGTIVGGVDLQSVATHEMGHGLGLGHSSVPGATMVSTISIGSIGARSIEADDIAGVQAIYGVAAATKPRITGLVDINGTLKIRGTNFVGTGNEVWFTNANGSGIPSSNGIDLFVNVPSNAAPGDLLVKVPGSSYATLSNAWPFDPTQPLPCMVKSYGQTAGGANKLSLATSGSPTLGQTITLNLNSAPFGAVGWLHFARSSANQPLLGGTQLINLNQIVQTTLLTVLFNPTQIKLVVPPNPGLAGVHVFGKAAVLDVTQPGGLAFSNGLELTLCAP